MVEPGQDSYEERPKLGWFLYLATSFFGLLALSLVSAPNTLGKWLWLAIAVLNLIANVIQITYSRSVRYVLWRHGLSVYVRGAREALVRFDRALLFKPFKGFGAASRDMRQYEVKSPLRTFPVFSGSQRWLLIYEDEDGSKRALALDPSRTLQGLFRQALQAAEPEGVSDAEEGAPGSEAPAAAPDDGTAAQQPETPDTSDTPETPERPKKPSPEP